MVSADLISAFCTHKYFMLFWKNHSIRHWWCLIEEIKLSFFIWKGWEKNNTRTTRGPCAISLTRTPFSGNNQPGVKLWLWKQTGSKSSLSPYIAYGKKGVALRLKTIGIPFTSLVSFVSELLDFGPIVFRKTDRQMISFYLDVKRLQQDNVFC